VYATQDEHNKRWIMSKRKNLPEFAVKISPRSTVKVGVSDAHDPI